MISPMIHGQEIFTTRPTPRHGIKCFAKRFLHGENLVPVARPPIFTLALCPWWAATSARRHVAGQLLRGSGAHSSHIKLYVEPPYRRRWHTQYFRRGRYFTSCSVTRLSFCQSRRTPNLLAGLAHQCWRYSLQVSQYNAASSGCRHQTARDRGRI